MHLGNNLVHLCCGEGSNRGRVNIPCRSNVQEQSRSRLVVWGFKNQHAVVIAQSPVDVRDFDAQLLADAFTAAARFVVSSMSLIPCWVNLIVVMNVAMSILLWLGGAEPCPVYGITN